jgi:hypothetical protein
MALPPSFAPADRLNAERAKLSELTHHILSLRRGQPVVQRMLGGCQHGVISAIAALLAYLPAQPLGLKEGFWASITAISVAQTEFNAARTTARDQAIGALVGGLVGVCASMLAGQGLGVYAASIAISMAICWALNVASASRLAGSTLTIVVLVPHQGSVQQMFASRLAEVGWGICVAVTVVWLAGRLPARFWGRPPKVTAGTSDAAAASRNRGS